MFKSKKVRLTSLTTQADEAIRVALEVLHGARVRFLHKTIDPQGRDTDTIRMVNIEGLYTTSDRTHELTFDTSIQLTKSSGQWEPIQTTLAVSFQQKFYYARWEDRAFVPTVLVAPSIYHEGSKIYWVGTSWVDRWNEPVFPKRKT